MRTNASFAGFNNGNPQQPLSGGYGPAPQLPAMRAPTPEVIPAGIGAIGEGIDGFFRAFFTSHPPMAGRSTEANVDAVIASNPNFWR